MASAEMRTQNLVLRRWREGDRGAFAEMNADREVMLYLGQPLGSAESDALMDWFEAEFDQFGFGLWALESAETEEFIGFTGLSVPRFDAPFMPAVEVAWRLNRRHWGHGYATEAATRALAFGFETVGLEEIVAFASRLNLRSQAVMRRIGMRQDASDDFERAGKEISDPLRPHVLWRIRASQWHAQRGDSQAQSAWKTSRYVA